MQTNDQICARPLAGQASQTPWQALGGAFLAAFEAIIEWQRRASERAHVESLPDHLLKDIGLTRQQLLCGDQAKGCL